MNGHYKIGIDQEALYKLALKFYTKEVIFKTVGMHEELFNHYLKVDLNTQRDQMAIKLYFRLESMIPIPKYLEFRERKFEKYNKRLAKFEGFRVRNLLPPSR